ncbi:S8 family serine peptidase [Actinomadura sp. GC306]|uniref:S8 family serine peptidase n=1 Tax=Actinomadura sp. GC306 TaxID=2530367 RepID=UPI001404BA52|nr:S8 family serine peptidase [Actinomadura sp. GC306]
MSGAGRRRPARARPATRLGARTTAALTVLTLGAAVVVPAQAMAGRPADPPPRGAATGMLVGAPTDQIRDREWHLEALRTQRAWRYSKGRGVTVAVLDTGVDKNHPDLTGQVINGPDLTGGVRAPGSRYWGLHGTSMASIIAGHGHGPGLTQGMMGVAPQSTILSIRVTLENDDPLRRDNGQPDAAGERDAVAEGIRYAVDHGAEIVNMSLGGGRQFYNGTKSQESAIKYALGKGVVLIASAGNDGSGANRKNFPAAYPGVIAVGALDRRLRLWQDSNRRSHASVCAPGVDIVSADASNGYVVGTGTSASSAMVAGVAALVRSRYPRLTPDEVRQALVQGSPARPGQPTGSTACRGTVDALRTLYAAHAINKTSSGPVQTPPPPASPEPVADNAVEETGILLPLVLGGGAVLVVIGLVLGWRQRRRPEDDTDETDIVSDYGLPAAAPAAPAAPPPTPVAAPGPAAPTGVAPVNAPLWQSTDVFQGPSAVPGQASPDGTPGEPEVWDEPSEPDVVGRWSNAAADDPPGEPWGGSPSPLDTAPLDPSWGTPSATGGWFDRESPQPEPDPVEPEQPSALPHKLRPFEPGEFATNGGGTGNGHKNGHDAGNGHRDGGVNGSNGASLNGSGPTGGQEEDDAPGLNDEEWEAFRRSTLDAPETPQAPADGWATGALPESPPAEPGRSRGPADQPDGDQHIRRTRPSDDEDYRPPWW